MFTCKIEAGFRVFIFIILPFVLTNCIREDMSGCPRDDGGLALKFSYDTNADSRQSTAQGIDRLAVFIFDEKGVFISQVNDSMTSINDDYVMELPYKQGSYQFVAWGGYDKMRLEKDREPRLRIADKTGTIRYDENLIGKLIGGNPNIDFEHNHDFTIEISFDNYIPVIIKINGWEIVNEEI